jgi:hypothetical protein
MSFALPTAFTLAVLALPIVALYILKVRLRRVPVSTNLFWQQIYQEKPPRSFWQRFRDLFSLLLQLLLLLLIVLAVADPFFSWQILQARRIVLVIDNSASMRAADVVPTRLDAAKAAASEIINGLRFHDEVAVVLAGSSPKVIVGMSGHVPTLLKAINSVSHSDSPTELAPAIELGQRLIDRHSHGQVIVFTDGAVDRSGLPPAVRKGETPAEPLPATDLSILNLSESGKSPVEYRIFATDASNVGITQLQVRRSLVDLVGYEILVSIHNASATVVDCRLELMLDDVPMDVIPLSLKPEERWNRSIEKTSLEGGRLHAVLTRRRVGTNKDVQSATEARDAAAASDSASSRPAPRNKDLNDLGVDMLEADNSAWALLPSRKRQRVLIVTQGNVFLQKVFEANSLVEVTVRKDFPDQWPVDTLIVLHGNVPEILPSGNVFVLDPTSSCDQWEQGAVLENAIVTEQDTSSPLMNQIRLDNVIITGLWQLQFTTPPHSLAKTLSGENVYAEMKRSNGKCLVLSVNLDRSDLAFRTAFPILVANSLSWFSGSTGELRQAFPTGTVAKIAIPDLFSGAGELDLIAPDGETSSILVKAGESDVSIPPTESGVAFASIGPLNKVGVWSVEDHQENKETIAERTERSLAEIAVNLANERETNLRPLTEFNESSRTQFTTVGWFSRPLWYYFVLLASLLTTIEWILYQRRLIS